MPRGRDCAAHVHDQLIPQERHHVWPLGYHGPNAPENIAVVCANAHSDTHYLLEALLRGRDVDLRTYGPRVRDLAYAGRDAVLAYGEALAAHYEGSHVAPTL